MDRRSFVAAIGGAIAALAPGLRAQGTKPRRIGVLGVSVSSSEQVQWAKLQFAALLRKAGLEEGRDIEIEWRHAEGDASRLPALVAELVNLKVELIVASFNQSIAAAKKATQTIPIVMLNAVSPVEQGFVASLARPGGNVTGTAWSSPETMGKILQVLKEAAPNVKRVAMLGNPSFPGERGHMRTTVDSAAKLGLTVEFFEASRPEEIGPALERIGAARVQALYFATDTVLISGLREVADYARKKKLVSMSTASQFVDMGGVLYYGPDINELGERTVSYVVRILAGAKPADLPVELPTNYRLIVSKKAAAAIGHKIPPAFLARADQVID
jgi:putative ABC transport system substrate-binding protein